VQEGVAVKKGQQLAEIELTEVNAQVEQARQLANKADRDLARGENLYADQVISLEQLQNLRTQAALAKAQLRAADFNRGYAAITAPGDAVVLRRLAEERQLVPAGQPILILGGSGRGFVMRCALADREVVQLKLGDRGTAQLDAFPGKSFVATVSEIARVSDPVTGLFDVELRFDAAPVGLVSGLIARIELSPAAGVTHTLTYIPIGALVQADGNRASVFVVADDTARKRDVEVAFIAADSVALAAGVAPGDAVVSDGALYLDDGEHIRILATGEPDSR
jgi:RND family efflux transporter MFP subunit